MNFLKIWIEEQPPQYGESNINYLKRHKWNPYPNYYTKLQSLHL